MDYDSKDLTTRLLEDKDKDKDKDKDTEDPTDKSQNTINKNVQIKEWNDSIEELLKCWGEKTAGLSIIHDNDRKYWREKSNHISIASILITTVSSSISLSTTSSPYYEYIMYLVGFIGLLSSLLQSFKQFYNADEKASDHRVIAKQFGNYYRSIKLQLALKREDRVPVGEFTNWAFKEYEKLLQESPPVKTITVENFRERFKQYTCYKPDICETDIVIDINKRDI